MSHRSKDALACVIAVLSMIGCPGDRSTFIEPTSADGGVDPTSSEDGSTGVCFREGASFCEADDECACMVATYEDLTQPRTPPSAFNANACVEVSVCPDAPPVTTCRCFDDVQGRGGDLLDGDADGCLWGGGPAGCLYTVAEFTGCDLADAVSCDATCAVLNAREQEEAMRTYAVSRRGIRCNAGVCEGIVSIDGLCYVAGHLEHAYDCALDDAEIFAEHDAHVQEQLELPPDPCGGSTSG